MPITGIENNVSETPITFMLEQNYPNPFNPTTNLEFGIPASPQGGLDLGFVSLKVYNSVGQLVTVLVNEKKTPGRYKVQFDGSNFPSGIYFYSLNVGSYSETRRMILLK